MDADKLARKILDSIKRQKELRAKTPTPPKKRRKTAPKPDPSAQRILGNIFKAREVSGRYDGKASVCNAGFKHWDGPDIPRRYIPNKTASDEPINDPIPLPLDDAPLPSPLQPHPRSMKPDDGFVDQWDLVLHLADDGFMAAVLGFPRDFMPRRKPAVADSHHTVEYIRQQFIDPLFSKEDMTQIVYELTQRHPDLLPWFKNAVITVGLFRFWYARHPEFREYLWPIELLRHMLARTRGSAVETFLEWFAMHRDRAFELGPYSDKAWLERHREDPVFTILSDQKYTAPAQPSSAPTSSVSSDNVILPPPPPPPHITKPEPGLCKEKDGKQNVIDYSEISGIDFPGLKNKRVIRGAQNKTASKVGDLPFGVTTEDLSTLTGDKWLNSGVIDGYISLLNQELIAKHLQHAFTRGEVEMFERGRRMKKNFVLDSGVGRIFIPLHDRNHWFSVVAERAADAGPVRVYVLDSLYDRSKKGKIPVVEKIIESVFQPKYSKDASTPTTEYIYSKVRPQQDGNSCGVYMLDWARKVLGSPIRKSERENYDHILEKRGARSTNQAATVHNRRLAIYNSIVNRKITPNLYSKRKGKND